MTDVGDTETPPTGDETAVQHAERLRERVYVSFTALAVIIALSAHPGEVDAGAAALTLFVTVAGVLLAGFAADLVAHVVAHAELPHRAELAHLVRVALGGLASVTVPLLLIAASGLGWLRLPAALRAGQLVLIVTLGALGLIALRRVRLPFAQRVLLIALLVAIGAGAVALELFAHTL